MKALELAFKQEVYVGGTLGFDSAAELRRLAKVNAELLEALEKGRIAFANPHKWILTQEAIDYFDKAIAKAKEQQ